MKNNRMKIWSPKDSNDKEDLENSFHDDSYEGGEIVVFSVISLAFFVGLAIGFSIGLVIL